MYITHNILRYNLYYYIVIIGGSTRIEHNVNGTYIVLTVEQQRTRRL